MTNRKGTLIDKANWESDDAWYRVDNRIAWYDRRIRLWTTYTLDSRDYQDSIAQYGTLADMVAGTYSADTISIAIGV